MSAMVAGSHQLGARVVRRSFAAAVVGVVALLAAACVPPTYAPPALPSTVGVEWLRDTGGTMGPVDYEPVYAQYSILAGVLTGPGPVTPMNPSFPDGGPSFPWNGFAGQGMTTTVTPSSGGVINYTLNFPGGSCGFASTPTNMLLGLSPSPDGTKVAVMHTSVDAAPMTAPTSVSIQQLGAGCPAISGAGYTGEIGGVRGGGGDRIASPAFVWSPASTAILYSLSGPGSNDTARIARLDAMPGATPVVVLDEGAGTAVVPTGWGPGGRVLMSTSTPTPGTASGVTSTIQVVDVGVTRRIIDTAAVSSTLAAYAHIGYFVPGTATVVYQDGSATVTNPQGSSYPWMRVRLYDDVTWGKASILGVDPPLTWHTEGSQDVPNGERVKRFVR